MEDAPKMPTKRKKVSIKPTSRKSNQWQVKKQKNQRKNKMEAQWKFKEVLLYSYILHSQIQIKRNKKKMIFSMSEYLKEFLTIQMCLNFDS